MGSRGQPCKPQLVSTLSLNFTRKHGLPNNMTKTSSEELLAVALQAAESARESILSYYNGEFDIEIKDDQTPVTVADRAAERIIRETIGQAFPDHGIFGEEYGAESKDTEYLWLVDGETVVAGGVLQGELA